MRYPKGLTFLLVGLVSVLTASAVLSGERLVVYTVNYPLQYFAQRIAGEHAQVVFPAPAEVDPAFWMPDAATIAGYQQADLILLNGAGYAKWIDRVSLPRLRTVDTSRGFRERYLASDPGPTHSHGPAGDHSHAGVAFTTWLDPLQSVEQARAVLAALTRKRPELQEVFEANFVRLEQDLTALDQRLSEITRPWADQALLASHPVYQYLARRYALNLRSLMWEPDEPPPEPQWDQLEATLREHPALWMLWEGEPDPESVTRLQALGVSSLVFAPGANRPAQGDFMTLMQHNLAQLERAFP